MREALASYIEATYHLSHPKVVNLRRRLLMDRGIAQTPYIESTPAYVGNRKFATLDLDPKICDFLTTMASKDAEYLLFDPPYEHQAQALEKALAGNAGGTGIVVTTGTGSGKTESFLLPVLARLAEEAIYRADHFSTRAVRALLLYPMNALVNDQLGRLRTLFGSTATKEWFTNAAERPAKFGRYTGRTLYPGIRDGDRDQKRLKTLEYYLKIEDGARSGDAKDQVLVNVLKEKGRWPAKPDSSVGAFDGLRNWYGNSGDRWETQNGEPLRAIERPEDPELLTRHEIQDASPDLLITNYSMLEYMLLRPIERKIFADTRAYFEVYPEEKFFLILDEAHLYRGANGTEVAYLIRRLLDRLGLPPSRVVFIATSASFSDGDAAADFIAGLSGLGTNHIQTIRGDKRSFEPAGDGSVDLATALASIPLALLQSPSPTDRSQVLAPLAAHAKASGMRPVVLTRKDSGVADIFVTVHGRDETGAETEELVIVASGATVTTEKTFRVVDDVRTDSGSVVFARSYFLGTATSEKCEWDEDDLPAALAATLDGMEVLGRLRNITSGASSLKDPIESPGAAWAFSALPKALFPSAHPNTAAAAVDALLELASLAKATPKAAPLLPARVHMLFRGLPGLWACANPQCDQISPEERGGPTGALYAEARQNCGCGSQVYELHSCRDCGLSVARANVGAPTGVEHLWQDNGRAYAGNTDVIKPIHICLEDPLPQKPGMVRPVYLDLSSGRIDGTGTFNREVWLPPITSTTKLFEKCPRCEAVCGENALGGISDLQTKGEQPFKELITVQVLEQAPRPESHTPLQGRKALVFSDGRQSASRLAGDMKTFSFRDSLRPLLLVGMAAFRHPTYRPSLNDAPLAVALGARKFGVRLRPLGDDDGVMDRAGKMVAELVNNDDAENDDFRGLTAQTSNGAPLSVFQSIYAVLQDDHTGLFPLALAMLRPKLTKTEQQKLIDELKLPTVEGMTDDEVRSSLIELWLWQAMRKHAIKLQATPSNIESAKGSSGVRLWNGKFSRVVATALERRALKTWVKGDFLTGCEPVLRAVFSHGEQGDFHVQASRVTLDPGDSAEWLRCERCTKVSPSNALLGPVCGYCGGSAKPIDPAHDFVFRSRKAFYRRLWERLNDPDDTYAPHQLIAEEHSAALNDSGLANAMSRNEAYELRFQDIPIEQDGRVGSPIDILSCTTTMEVGIDIGGLTAVALRNVPPGRANYQQRAGRAGRRGAGLSTVVMFCGADSHDQSFFRDPAPIVAGPAPDPILNLDNPVIVRRQALAYLIGRFQQDRIDTVDGSADVFSSLGSVADFMNGTDDVFSLAGFKQWIAEGRDALRLDLERMFTIHCPALDADKLLDAFPASIQQVLTLPPQDASAPKPAKSKEVEGDFEDEAMEDADDEEHAVVDSGKLLDRLFDVALLPKYAFPTDVATFSVFESDTDPWRPKRRYSPQLGLNAALSQYAPGHEVYVDSQRYISLGLYSEHENDRHEAWRNRRLYYQCQVCNYADLKDLANGYVDETRDCPACANRGALGPARRWVRPTGFSHPPTITALPPDFDAGTRLRPTRATLDSLQFSHQARIGGEIWPMGTGWEAWGDSKTLVVTNRGTLSATDYGFNYCNKCGRIEPADFDPALRRLRSGQSHPRPRPNRPKEAVECDGNPNKVVLGNEFKTDVAVFRLALPSEWALDPDRPSTTIAARSAVEALRRAACRLEDLEPNDIDGDFRFAPSDGIRQYIDLYLYDQAAGGAGFVKAAARDPQRLVDDALKILDSCNCDDSCYQCLRSYKNRFEHELFDRRIGADLLRAAFKGVSVSIDSDREDLALNRLEADLTESGAKVVRAEGGLIKDNGEVICLAHPFVAGRPASSRGATLANGKKTVAVDILLVSRALPIATSEALSIPNVDPSASLNLDADGVPELSAAAVEVGDLTPNPTASHFAVSGAEEGDFLFRLTANVLSGKKGDGNAPIPKGTMCLFRPHDGVANRATEKTDVFLLRRTDGKVFGATGEAWTVGLLQSVTGDAIRVRYRPASQFMECASELVQPANAVLPVALFLKALT
jgi:ATP-dependent helicase YprA (DUF1998 family)